MYIARPLHSHAQYTYENTPLLKVVQDLQKQTDYRFLYREPLLAGITVSLESDASSFPDQLKNILEFTKLDASIDTLRKQIIIFKRKTKTTKRAEISGQVVDAKTGERLPFATLIVANDGRTSGLSSNSSGGFSIRQNFTAPLVTIKATYLGYKAYEAVFDIRDAQNLNDLTFRLQPTNINGNEILITGNNISTDVDESLLQQVQIGTFSPLGETNSIRALQQLPAVTISAAMDGGVNARGSTTDAFRVLLDGITIYKQSHIYGLVDSFNGDILQTNGLFYDITPAEYQAPPGGTLALYTKTGSLNELQGSAGISNSTFKLSLEGPLKKGKSSWVISSRNSYMDAIDWLNNSDLIQFGLNVDRDREVLEENQVDLNDRLVTPTKSNANFFDLHGKLYLEGDNGSRLIMSGYFGRDDTEQFANRLFRTFSAQRGNIFEPRPVSTENEWSNFAGSVQYQTSLKSHIYSRTTAAASIYQSDYRKDDFIFNRFSETSNTFQSFTFPFENESVLNEIKFEQAFNITIQRILFTAGAQYQYLKGEYSEDSFDRPGFFDKTTAHRVDSYVQAELLGVSFIDLFAGNRFHYYSNGNYTKWSPRIKLRLFPDSKLSIGGGVSRNFQFINEVSLSNVTTSDIWILADDVQEPASANYYSAGIYYRGLPKTYIQIEGYIKDYENLRLHELNTLSVSNTFTSFPWFSQNDGKGKGVEIFIKNSLSNISLSHGITVSSMELQNPLINDGEEFYADWDRRLQYTSTLEINPFKNVTTYLAWIFATGNPSKLATFGPANDERLGDYQRLDLSVEYTQKLAFGEMEAGFSIYNLLDRDNPWYRDRAFVIDNSEPQRKLRSKAVDVFDLGIQPSFNVTVHF